jgi:hypothetical protein
MADTEPYGLWEALVAVAEREDLDRVAWHGLTPREVIDAEVEKRRCGHRLRHSGNRCDLETGHAEDHACLPRPENERG